MKKNIFSKITIVVLSAFCLLCLDSCQFSGSTTESDDTQVTFEQESTEASTDAVEFSNKDFEEEQVDEDMSDVFSNTEI